jgi:hypothetical protein
MAHPLPSIRDDFQVKENDFNLPDSTLQLDPKTKRRLTICNLFINHRLPIIDIARLLDEEPANVVLALIERGIVHDRRKKWGRAPHGIERRRLREKSA